VHALVLTGHGCLEVRRSDCGVGEIEHVLTLSYGKDSMACIGAIEELGWQLDRIVHAEVWATDTIPANLPPMMEFKAKADAIIKERWGIEVEHHRAKYTFEQAFHLTRGRTGKKTKFHGLIYGWPMVRGQWCLQQLKLPVFNGVIPKDAIQYLGIAADEPKRFGNLSERKKSPLVALDWDEQQCYRWSAGNNLLSPTYTTSNRDGCWFCHNQGIDQLRNLRNNYPEYWQLMLRWDEESPVSFKPDGRTVHDFERRFQLEDDGYITPQDRFKWEFLERQQIDIFAAIRRTNCG